MNFLGQKSSKVNEDQITGFFKRIDQLTPGQQPLFGKMNVNQMVCHCTDQIRLALGTIVADEYGAADPAEIISLARSGKTVPTAKGLGQVEGGGTRPTGFDNDIKYLKQHILDFSKLDNDFDFKPHPFFGTYNKRQWTKLTLNHLDHHLKQFQV